MSAPARGPGLVHAAVISRTPDDVVRQCLPELRQAVTAGGSLEVLADRRHGRAFREALPDAAIAFPSPVDHDARSLVRRLASPGGAAAVVGTACAELVANEGSGPAELAEDTLTLLLADTPITIICIYDPADPVGVQVARRSHPWLLGAEGRVANPDHRPPEASSPVPAPVIGPSVLDVPVAEGAALSALRTTVAERARSQGLAEHAVQEIVLAAHEGLLVAGGAFLDGDDSSDLPDGSHHVTLRRSPHGTVAECRGTPPPALTRAGQSDRLLALSRLCDGLAVHDGADGRLVRVLVRHH